jgi:hypothetical protein
MTWIGFPHSGFLGSLPASGFPRLIAAGHALHRLLMPRHPPYALCSLTTVLFLVIHASLGSCCFALLHRIQLSKNTTPLTHSRRSDPPARTCGADPDRTGDLLLAKQALSQLSYSPEILLRKISSRTAWRRRTADFQRSNQAPLGSASGPFAAGKWWA